MPSWIDRFRRPPTRSDSLRSDGRTPLRSGGDAGGDSTTQLHAFDNPILGALVIEVGPAAFRGRQFVIRNRLTRIGRGDGCEVLLNDPRVSREHARLVPEPPHGLRLEHRSHTNATFLNGKLVTETCPLRDGDHILLAEDILLRLDAPLLGAGHRDPPSSSLRDAMEERVHLETRIREQFMRDGSFLDIDVVDSYGLKQDAAADRVFVSFERFRRFIEREIKAHAGRVLNSNGDEVMCFFESAERALEAAQAIRKNMDAFNAGSNLLGRPFAVRMGIDTGRCAVDLERGVAYSPILDGAGHLQKAAPPGGVLVSEATRQALTGDALPLEEIEHAGKSHRSAWLLRPDSA